MKTTTNILVSLAGLGSILIGEYLTYMDKDGWGWFLIGGLLCLGDVVVVSKKGYKKKDLQNAFYAGRNSEILWENYLENIKSKEDESNHSGK